MRITKCVQHGIYPSAKAIALCAEEVSPITRLLFFKHVNKFIHLTRYVTYNVYKN